MNKEISLRKLNVNDVEDMAVIHFHSFKGFFLTSLGQNFLKVFYKEVLKHKDGIGIGAFDEQEKMLGFAVGAQQNRGFYKKIIKSNGFGLAWVAFPELVKDPAKIIRLVRNLMSKGDQDYNNSPILLSICVKRSQEAKGIGRKLLSEFENVLKELAYNSLILFTDTHNNNYPNQFYQNNNYILVKSFLQGKREMNLYYKKLNP